MKITFACTGCGKTLKARPDSAGRTRKCPVCATRVTCPEAVAVAHPVDDEVFDAELVEAEVVPVSKVVPASRRGAPPHVSGTRAAFDAFADVDDEPYQVVGADTAAEPPSEPKKPCPMCGETIMASAAKCRFCGEVFDSRLKKGKSRNRRKSSGGGGSSSAGARDIGIGILCMGLGIGLTVATLAAASNDATPGRRFVLFYGLILGGFAQMCRGIYGLMRYGA